MVQTSRLQSSIFLPNRDFAILMSKRLTDTPILPAFNRILANMSQIRPVASSYLRPPGTPKNRIWLLSVVCFCTEQPAIDRPPASWRRTGVFMVRSSNLPKPITLERERIAESAGSPFHPKYRPENSLSAFDFSSIREIVAVSGQKRAAQGGQSKK